MGIEPTQPAWKAGALPLSYTRMRLTRYYIIILFLQCQYFLSKILFFLIMIEINKKIFNNNTFSLLYSGNKLL